MTSPRGKFFSRGNNHTLWSERKNFSRSLVLALNWRKSTVKSLIWHEQHSFTYTCMSWRVVTQYHNSRKKFLWNSQLSKSCRALFPDIFTVKKAIGENNSVTTYNLWHFLPLPFVSKQLVLWSYSFVQSKVRISKSLHKEKKEKNWVTESVEWRSDSQVKEIPLDIC